MSKEDALTKEAEQTSLSLASITDGITDRDIPKVKFLEDIEAFSNSFDPPASAELMIGAFSDLFGKMKNVEGSLSQRAQLIQSKLPEIDKSLKLVSFLKSKEQSSTTTLSTRYNLADMLFAKAEVDTASGIVNLWLGANVMLEYTYDEAIDLLSEKQGKAKTDLEQTKEDLALVRNQIITAEVNISRIYNYDVRRKRQEKVAEAEAKGE
mmetsp:Transcript_23304/g.34099  ORF Transcript_23304/g.34099 Transcript_23304/m.34099 type:complete len:209 (+) Transcript_23304:138-764(+)